MTKTAALAAGLALLGCGTARAPEKPRIALVMKSLANEFFKTMEDGARAHQHAHSAEYELLATGIKDEQDVAGQVRLVEQMIADRASALVIAPADSKALVSACRKAQEAGVVVVNIDNQLDAAVLAERRIQIPFVGPDNRKGARAVGEYLARRLAKGDKAAILEGVPNAFNGVERKRGFEAAMQDAGIVVAASQSAAWETAKANQVASALLSEIPDLKAFLCANDSMALGAVSALKSADRRDVLVVGFDNITAVRELVKDGRILATADQHADRLAVFGIEYALEMLKTKATPGNRETPVDLVTAESLK
jgi:ribose transport system substrate-binding protein